MAHARETIRKAIVTAVTGLTTTGSRVEDNRTELYEPDELPALNVLVQSEEYNPELSTFDYEIRVLEVDIEARVRYAGDDVSDVLDDICSEIEAAVPANAALVALLDEDGLEYQGTQFDWESESERDIGLATVMYQVRYQVAR